jgi:hypothetical protein
MLYARIALAVYLFGLLLTVVFNVYNGRSTHGLPVPHKDTWGGLLILRGILLYPSIAVLTYWSVQTMGVVMGILAGFGALIFKSLVNRVTWRMF